MHKPPDTAFKAWSVSKLKDFESCPKKYYHATVIKTHPFTETEQTRWGNVCHKQLEDRVTKRVALPVHLAAMEPIIEKAEQTFSRVMAEVKIAIDRNWNPVSYFARAGVWARGVIDVLAWAGSNALVLDWKTGKPNQDKTQLNFYGAVLEHTGFKDIKSIYVWLKDRSFTSSVINTANATAIREDFNRRVEVLETAHAKQEFPAKASPLCAWCPLVDTCEEGKKYRGKAKYIRGNASR